MLIIVKGKTIDDQTRCVHYHSPLDIIAIKLKCCHEYYPCYYCHEEEAGHPVVRWEENEFSEEAILCGVCKNEMTIQKYLDSGDKCPLCGSAFNPRCREHYHFYFNFKG